MLGMISFGSGLGSIFLLIDAASSKKDHESGLSPVAEIGLGLGLLVIAVICAVLSKVMGEDD